MLITLIILVLSAAFFVAGKVRSDIVALCALIGLLIFQILTPEEALSGFSNSVVIMMVGLFVVGGAIFQTGLAKMISSRILKLAGKSELKLFLLVMLVTSAIGAFVSNTGTVADAAYRGELGAECRNESQPSIDAFGFCQQYGRYDDTYRYAS
jgi:di/tricarboxylate transporter